MMSDEKSVGGSSLLVIPPYKHCPELKLKMAHWENAMRRLPEAKNLAAANYLSLEFDFQDAWRESKTNYISVMDAVKKAKQNIEEIKADIILDEIPKMMEGKPKSHNNADFRKAVFAKNEDYKKALEHLEKLEALELHFESHMKIMENTSRFLKKQMDHFRNTGIGR